MVNSGYVMIDCTGVDLGNLGTVDGLYDKVKSALSTGKVLVLTGIVNSTQGFSNIVAYGGTESASSVFLTFSSTTLHISSSDVVTM